MGGGALWKTEAAEKANRPIRYDWIEIRPGAGVRLEARSAASLNRGRRTMTVAQFSKEEGALAALNAGFFNAQGFAVSTLVENGLLVSSGRYPTRPMMLFMKDGSTRIGR